MNLLPSAGPGRTGLRRLVLAVASMAWLVLNAPCEGQVQEELTIPELESLYRGAEGDYIAAFEALALLSSQFDRASQNVSTAQAAGDEAARNRWYEETLRLAPERRLAQRNVEGEAQELRDARDRLLEAYANYLDDLLLQTSTATDPETQRGLATFVSVTSARIQELRSAEDPQVTLEPLPEINWEPRDGPELLRNKATILDLRAGQYEAQYAYNQVQLEALRREQDLLRRSNDFLAGITRFDDPMTPVGPPVARTVPPPGQVPPPPGADTVGIEGGFLTLEQRILALETLQGEITQAVQTIRGRAAMLRRLAGGEWAWQ